MNSLSTIALIWIFAIYFDLFLTGEALKGSKKLDGRKPHGNSHSQAKSGHSQKGGAFKEVKSNKATANHVDVIHQMKPKNVELHHTAASPNMNLAAGFVPVTALSNENQQKNENPQKKSHANASTTLDKDKKKHSIKIATQTDDLNSQLAFCRANCCKTADGFLTQKDGHCQRQKESIVLVRKKRADVNCNNCGWIYDGAVWSGCDFCDPNAEKLVAEDGDSEISDEVDEENRINQQN